MLIYAAGAAGEDGHEVVHLGTRLIVFPLDRTVTPDELLGQVAEIAMRIARA